MICKHCGNEVPDQEKYCPFCGRLLIDPEEQKPAKPSKPAKPVKVPHPPRGNPIVIEPKMIAAAVIALLSVAIIVFVILRKGEEGPEKKYQQAESSLEGGDYEQAIADFSDIEGYKDTADKIRESYYRMAVKQMENGSYEDALFSLEAAQGFKDSAELILECHYNIGLRLMEEGDYKEAVEHFETAGDYSDAAGKIEECYVGVYGEYYKRIKNARVGDTLFFGSFEQDNNENNGRERIEWKVVDRSDDGTEILLVSVQVLDRRRYHTREAEITWEYCTLREWLNDTFLNESFSEQERKLIALTNVPAAYNPQFNTDPGNSTQDYVFILSILEAEKYFPTDAARKCRPTAYTKAKGVHVSQGVCWWWLRSPGDRNHDAAYIHTDGSFDYHGSYVHTDTRGVRPAMWLTIGNGL